MNLTPCSSIMLVLLVVLVMGGAFATHSPLLIPLAMLASCLVMFFCGTAVSKML